MVNMLKHVQIIGAIAQTNGDNGFSGWQNAPVKFDQAFYSISFTGIWTNQMGKSIAHNDVETDGLNRFDNLLSGQGFRRNKWLAKFTRLGLLGVLS